MPCPLYFLIFPGNFVEKFECLVCTRVAKNMEMTKIGFGKMPYQANSDHYGCPVPDTGYSLSDQHILSPINPKYDLSNLRKFTKTVLKFKTCRTCALSFRTICVNLHKYDKISVVFSVNW